MSAKVQKCLLILLLSLTANGCATRNNGSFEWLDIQAVPVADTEMFFSDQATYGDLAKAYINLKHSCRATNRGVFELQEAQKKLKDLK